MSKIKGTVLVKKKGTNKFVPINPPTEIPVGSQVDATKGTITLIAGLGGGRTNSSDFYSGRFLISQAKTRNAFMMLTLEGGKSGRAAGAV